MTEEGLHSKSNIAAELAWRDQQIKDLEAQLEATTNRWRLAMELLQELGADSQYYFDRAKALLAKYGENHATTEP